MFENPRRSRQARNFTTNVSKILDLKSSSEQIFFRNLSLGAPGIVVCSFARVKVLWCKWGNYGNQKQVNACTESRGVLNLNFVQSIRRHEAGNLFLKDPQRSDTGLITCNCVKR